MPELLMNTDQQSPKASANILTYKEQMGSLRVQLNGAPYCKDVHELLPGLTEHAIRNIVNGRGQNELVLTALQIVVAKRAQKQLSEAARLQKVARRLGVACPA